METLDDLTSELAWIRRLAQALVKDAAAADDVAQEAWIAAAGRAPTDRPVRPWLSRVVLNVVRMRARSAKRRASYEGEAPSAEPVQGTDEMIARVETQRLVAGEVLALAEPYRSTILLHYFEGLSSAEIARRLGIPDGTVRRRLKVALSQLRTRLELSGGENDRAWIAPVAGLANYQGAAGAGGAVVMKKIAIAALILVLVALALTVWFSRDGRRRERVATHVETATIGAPAVSPSSAVPAWLVQPGAASRAVAGRVVFGSQPFAGATVALRVRAQPDVALADTVTRADGTFSFGVLPPAAYVVTASAPNHSPAIVEIELENPRSHPEALLLVLGDCVWSATGTVGDAAGVAIPHATVRIDALVGVETDDAGHYALCRPLGSSFVTVSASGYGSVTAEFAIPGTIERDFMLVPEAILVGRVIRAGSEAPVFGAQVVVVPAENPISRVSSAHALPTRSAMTDDDGRFQISGLAPGRFRVAATAPGLGSKLIDTYLEAGTSKELAISVDARSQVHGKVLASGSPVPGAQVTAVSPYELGGAPPVWSQADGSFVIDGVPPGIVSWEARGYEVDAPRTTAIDRAVVSGIVIEVTAAASIRGRVTTRGKPVANAAVSCTRLEWTPGFRRLIQTAQANLDGDYVIEGVPPGECRLVAVAGAIVGAFSEERKVTVAPGAVTRADIELAFDASVKGIVVDERGAPVRAAYVRITMESDGGEAMTDANGAFTIRSLRGGGDYQPEVSPSPIDAPPFPSSSGGPLPKIHVADAHAAVSGVTLVVRHERGMIRGKVVDGRGDPVSDARVEISYGIYPEDASPLGPLVVGMLPTSFLPNPGILSPGPSAMTDTVGHFELRDLVAGRYNLIAYGADGSSSVVHDIATGATDATITLARAGAIEGTLVGFTRVPTVVVTDHLYNENTAIPDANHFTIRGLSPGTYSVIARDSSGGESRAVEVRAGETAQVELHSRGTGRIDGRLSVLGAGTPVAGIRCVAAPAADGFGQWWNGNSASKTDESGHFAIDQVPAGTVHVECFGTAWSRAQREVTVSSGTIPTSVQLAVMHRAATPSNPGFSMYNEQLPPTVAGLDPHGGAIKAGLAVGDQIAAIDGISVEPFGVGGVEALLGNHARGSAAVLTIVRGSIRQAVTLVLQ